MKIGIDISQTAYTNTGVANYLTNLVQQLIKQDEENEYILFFSSLRKKSKIQIPKSPAGRDPASRDKPKSNVQIKNFKLPPSLLDLIWNKLHILPIETFIGTVDLFISSDWTEPPSRAKKATIIYDLTVYKSPEETAKKIVETQKRKLKWVKKESDIIFTISKSGKKDVEELLGIESSKIRVIYPGIS